jgi:hypothetical protein
MEVVGKKDTKISQSMQKILSSTNMGIEVKIGLHFLTRMIPNYM